MNEVCWYLKQNKLIFIPLGCKLDEPVYLLAKQTYEFNLSFLSDLY